MDAVNKPYNFDKLSDQLSDAVYKQEISGYTVN